MYKRSLRLAIGAAAAVALIAGPTSAMAKNGAGGGTGGAGGGTAVTAGVIKPAVSAGATCTGSTSMSVRVQKGNNKVVERVVTMSGNDTGGWWDFNLSNDATGRGLVVSGGTMSNLGASVAVITTSTGSTLQPGAWPVSYTATRRATQTGPVLETCTAHLTVVAV